MNESNELAALRRCYIDYIQFTKDVVAKARPTDGLFGFTRGPKDDPGHEKFYNDAEACVTALLAAHPTRADLIAAIEIILFSADENRENQMAYWMLFAAQKHALPLIPPLMPSDCIPLRDRYNLVYPHQDRLPVQKAVFRALKKRSKMK